MKIAVTSRGTSLESEVDPRFGRAAYILIVDTFSLMVEVLDNSENENISTNAGIQTAVMVSDSGAEVLLTGFCGKNAFKILNAVGVRVANVNRGTVREIVNNFNEGKISFTDRANVNGHWW